MQALWPFIYFQKCIKETEALTNTVHENTSQSSFSHEDEEAEEPLAVSETETSQPSGSTPKSTSQSTPQSAKRMKTLWMALCAL